MNVPESARLLAMFAGPAEYGWMNWFVFVVFDETVALETVPGVVSVPATLYDT